MWQVRQVCSPNPPVWASGGASRSARCTRPRAAEAVAVVIANEKAADAPRATRKNPRRPRNAGLRNDDLANGSAIGAEPHLAGLSVEHHVTHRPAARIEVGDREHLLLARIESDETANRTAGLRDPEAILVIDVDRVRA